MDITLIDHGSIVQFFPRTPAGRDFLDTCETEPWQWMGRALCVDHRYAEGLYNAAIESGLSVGGV